MGSSSSLFDFAVTTIFARECLEGAIIIGEYRTIVLRGETHRALAPGFAPDEALREITLSAIAASALALLVIVAIAIPVAILSANFDTSTAYIIEGVSKIVAAVSLLQLSLKLPKMLGIYGSRKKTGSSRKRRVGDRGDDHQQQHHDDDEPDVGTTPTRSGLTRRSIRFNVAWNIWREVAECGVFLIPFFLNRQDLEKIPLSAVVGSAVGLLFGYLVYVANQRLTKKCSLCVFAVLLLVVLSAGLFTGGSHKLEVELGRTKLVWQIHDEFWNVERLPMTILKPFGYNDSRTILEICCYWSWLSMSGLLHFRKYLLAPRILDSEKVGGSGQDRLGESLASSPQRCAVPKMIDFGDQATILMNGTIGDKTADESLSKDEESPEGSHENPDPEPIRKRATYVVHPEEAC
jgi:high-affinity iron transporter